MKLAEKAQNSQAKLRIMIALSNYYINRSNFQKCIEVCQKGISESLGIFDYETASQFYNNLSLCHSYMQEYDMAMAYSDKSIALKQKTTNEDGLANAYLNRGLILTNKGDYESGFNYYAKSEAIYLKHNNHVSLTQTYVNYGWDYTGLKQFHKARNYLNKALFHAKQSNDKIRQAGVWNAWGYYYKNAGYADSVAYSLEHALQLSLEAENNRNALLACQELATHYQNSGNIKLAFAYLNKAYNLKDTVFEEAKIQQAQSLNARHENARKEKQIELLNTQKQNNELVIQKQQLTLLAVSLLIVMLSIVSYFIFNRYRKRQKAQKERELHSQKEAERIRIARDMHDEVGAGLTRIVMRSEQVKLHLQSGQELKNGMVDTLEKMAAESRELSHSIGEIVWALNPKNDTFDALCAYLRNYAYDYFEEVGIACSINFPETIPNMPVSPDLRRNVFLILKESINNIVKYSEASEGEITLQLSENHFSLTIKDNGKGVNNDIVSSSGNGLGNMKKRAEECGGKFTFINKQGEGIAISIEGMPFKNQTKV
jgi:two-component system sensor histidine kinase UhpB